MVATLDLDVRTPLGARVWMTTLMSDTETSEGRQRLHIEARGESEAQSRQLLALVCERIASACKEGVE